mgnify:CR=1 FL=1|jgi:hypothetical protein|tara:strand:+ start:25114 stop:25566 length:453 start_codon:yes stop_codon:yes gene_type:complete
MTMNDIEKTYEHIEESYMEITKRYLKIDEDSIEAALYHHTGIFAFFSAVLAHAKREVDRASRAYDQSEARCREERRCELVEAGKRATDRSLDSYVKTLDELQQKNELVDEASHKYHLAKNIVNSLVHQKDMLVQISVNKRAEVKLIGNID